MYSTMLYLVSATSYTTTLPQKGEKECPAARNSRGFLKAQSSHNKSESTAGTPKRLATFSYSPLNSTCTHRHPSKLLIHPGTLSDSHPPPHYKPSTAPAVCTKPSLGPRNLHSMPPSTVSNPSESGLSVPPLPFHAQAITQSTARTDRIVCVDSSIRIYCATSGHKCVLFVISIDDKSGSFVFE